MQNIVAYLKEHILKHVVFDILERVKTCCLDPRNGKHPRKVPKVNIWLVINAYRVRSFVGLLNRLLAWVGTTVRRPQNKSVFVTHHEVADLQPLIYRKNINIRINLFFLGERRGVMRQKL